MSSLIEFPEIENAKKQYYLYKWYFEFYDSDNSETKVHPKKVIRIEKQAMYKTKVLPILTASMRFNNEDMVTLKNMNKRCLCDITCKSMVYNPTSSENTTNSKQTYTLTDSQIEFSSTFEPIFDKNTFKDKFNPDEVLENEEKSKTIDTPMSLDSPTQVVNITFFNIVPQKAMKTLYNTVIDEGYTIGTVLQWVCASTGLSYLIDTPGNQSVQPEIIIPPMNLTQTILYLQEVYGVYENGIQPFIDIDNKLYVLDKFASDHEREKDDVLLTHLYSYNIETSGGMSMIRALNDSNEPMYLGNPLIVNYDDEVLKGELVGNNYIFSSFQLGMDAVSYDDDNNVDSDTAKEVSIALKRNTETHNSSGEKTVVDYDEMNNLYNMTSKFNEVESMAKTLEITLQNANINDFKVNKFVEMHYQNTYKNNLLGGKYFINTVQFTFDIAPSAEIFKTSEVVNEEEDLGYLPTVTACNCTLHLSRRNPVQTASAN